MSRLSSGLKSWIFSLLILRKLAFYLHFHKYDINKISKTKLSNLLRNSSTKLKKSLANTSINRLFTILIASFFLYNFQSSRISIIYCFYSPESPIIVIFHPYSNLLTISPCRRNLKFYKNCYANSIHQPKLKQFSFFISYQVIKNVKNDNIFIS